VSGRHTGGTQGTTFLRGHCRSCGRELSGGNCESGAARGSYIMLRTHNNPVTGIICAGSRDRVPVDRAATAAYGTAKREGGRR
jgi:hypothetical protein